MEIVDAINADRSLIHEPGLDELLATHGGDTVTAATNYAEILNTDVSFLAFQTPSHEGGSIDTSIIETVVESLGESLQVKDVGHIVVTKSTLIPITTKTLAPSLTSGPTRPTVKTSTSR